MRQVCLWLNPAAGVIDIPMLIGTAPDGEIAYLESWGNVSPLLGPPYGAQYGNVAFLNATYNQSSSCSIELYNNMIFTAENPKYVPQPNTTGVMNVMQDLGLALAGCSAEGSVFCNFIRMYGEECQLVLDMINANLTIGVPKQKILYDPATICTPY